MLAMKKRKKRKLVKEYENEKLKIAIKYSESIC